MNSAQFSDAPELDPKRAQVHLLPVPLESTVSYGGGTNLGPAAILEASYQLENYDREFAHEPNLAYGIHTLPELVLASDLELAHGQIEAAVKKAYQPSKLLGVLGGEHSLTAPVVRAILSHHQRPITIVQIDAHCDLRDQYEGSKLSHASVSRRLLELENVERVLQLGIRSLCQEEADCIRSNDKVKVWFAEDVHAMRHVQEFESLIEGKDVYLTIDVDGFDPSIMPSTGTPEPNGLTYQQGEDIIRTVTRVANLLAFDCVELAPVAHRHAPDFMVAKLLYRLMNLNLAKL